MAVKEQGDSKDAWMLWLLPHCRDQMSCLCSCLGLEGPRLVGARIDEAIRQDCVSFLPPPPPHWGKPQLFRWFMTYGLGQSHCLGWQERLVVLFLFWAMVGDFPSGAQEAWGPPSVSTNLDQQFRVRHSKLGLRIPCWGTHPNHDHKVSAVGRDSLHQLVSICLHFYSVL